MTEQAHKQPFWETEGLPEPDSYVSLEVYQALPEVSFHIEWHDGKVIYPNWNEAAMSPSPTSRHQILVVRLLAMLHQLDLGGDLLTAPMDLHLGGRIIQPDVFWAAEGGRCVDRDNHYDGPPDLVIEVLSPSNTENVRVTKFDIYEETGVREYWIANPQEDYLEVYTLNEGSYRRVGAFKYGETFTSPVLQRTVPGSDIFGS